MLIKTRTQDFRPSILIAVATTPTIGLMEELGIGINKTVIDETTHRNFYRLRFGLDINLKPQLGLPLGFTATYWNDIPYLIKDYKTILYNFGVYEMISYDFNFGFELSKLHSSTKSLSLLMSLSVYY